MSDNRENIPLDDMLRNLKKSSAQKGSTAKEGGERVVRADGSRAIRVKSKKRRSLQPQDEKKKKSTKRKVVFIATAIGLLLLSVITFSILLGYFNGNRFKSKVTETIVNASGAEVELGRLDVSPASAKLSKVDLKWSDEDTLIQSLKINDIKADYGMLAFIGGGWGGSAVGVEKADLVLEMGKKNPQLNTTSERPVDFKFGLYQCSELNVNFGKDSLWNFAKGSISYRVGGDSGDQFSIDSGNLKVPRFGDFVVSSGLVNISATTAQVYLGLKAEDGKGSVKVDGEVGYFEGSPVDLAIELKDYSLRDWVDPRARRFISGNIGSAKGSLSMKIGDIDSFDITTKISSSMIRLDDFEFIKSLSEYLEEDYYLKPRFMDESELTMRRTNFRTEFTNIDLFQDAQLRVKGDFSIDEDDQMSGILKIGIPVIFLSTKKGELLKEVFSVDDGEYIWTDVVISGKTSMPNDNLSQKLSEAAIKIKAKVNGVDGGDSFEDKFKKLTE